MSSSSSLDWPAIRSRAAQFPEEAFEFVHEGVRQTVASLHGPLPANAILDPAEETRRHISGQQLCHGLKAYAIQRYGMLGGIVLARWGITKTDDFGTIVYALIDRKELRSSPRDSINDFKGVYDFADAFNVAAAACIC